jgi:hypothetical protein
VARAGRQWPPIRESPCAAYPSVGLWLVARCYLPAVMIGRGVRARHIPPCEQLLHLALVPELQEACDSSRRCSCHGLWHIWGSETWLQPLADLQAGIASYSADSCQLFATSAGKGARVDRKAPGPSPFASLSFLAAILLQSAAGLRLMLTATFNNVWSHVPAVCHSGMSQHGSVALSAA